MLKHLPPPTDEETDEVFNEMTPQEALDWSIRNNLPDYVKKAIERGANINFEDIDGYYPLIIATEHGKTGIVKLLIDAGCNINIKNGFGQTALIIASDYGITGIVKLLIDAGCDVNIK